jgi:membrane-bound lytic murein transglycosylase D
VTHSVASGDTLGALARRYRTTVRAIQEANTMGGRTMIRIGQRLQIPTIN